MYILNKCIYIYIWDNPQNGDLLTRVINELLSEMILQVVNAPFAMDITIKIAVGKSVNQETHWAIYNITMLVCWSVFGRMRTRVIGCNNEFPNYSILPHLWFPSNTGKKTSSPSSPSQVEPDFMLTWPATSRSGTFFQKRTKSSSLHSGMALPSGTMLKIIGTGSGLLWVAVTQWI